MCLRHCDASLLSLPPDPCSDPFSPISRWAPLHASIDRSFTDLLKPEHRLQPAPNTLQSLKNVFFASPFNLLLVCIPISWALYFALDRGDSTNAQSCQAHLGNNLAVFITAFLAIIPLAQLLSFGTEEIALRVGQTLGGLINATLGNAVELIVAIIALFHCELTIVQTSLIGSVLSNVLLVLGTW